MKAATDAVTRKALIKQFYRGNKLMFTLTVLSSLFMGMLNLMASWLIQQLLDTISGTTGARDLQTLTLLTAGLLVLIVLFGGLEYISRPLFMKKALQQYKEYAFDRLLRKSINTFHRERTAGYISALSNDVSSIEQNYLEKQFGLLSCAVTFVGAFVMMLIYSPLLTLIVVLLTICPVCASLLVGNRLEQAELGVSRHNESFTATLKESISGFSVIKSFKAEKAILELFIKNNRELEGEKCKRLQISILIGTISAVSSSLAQLGVFIAGAYLAISKQSITPGVVLVFVNLMNFILQPIAVLPEILASRKAARALMDKLCVALNENVSEGKRDIPAGLPGEIALTGLSFAYKAGEAALTDINLRFQAGKSYAIVGASGSGKSTLLNLLLAAYDNYTGSIRYDAEELRDISSESLYDVVSVIQQNVVIFNASLRENITMFGEADREEVDRAIRLSGLSDFVAEHGEEYLCGENGAALSGGERQRISIARSLLRRASVLLVDEATAALDRQTAYQVSNAILDIRGVTRLVVTHSLEEQLLKRYDEIIVLRAGRVAETGSFTELMERKEYFYSLYTVSQ